MSILGDRLRGTPTAIAVVFSLLFPGCAVADRNCTDEEKKAADKLLFLNDHDKKASITKHLPWGMPKRALASDERLLAHWDYVIGYDDSLRLPLWAAYRLDAKGINKTPERVNCFRQDPRINLPMASLPSDYEEKNYDQGHLAPSEDMSHTKNQNINSFIMSNMTPQSAPFNQIIWRRLETQARNWAIARKTVYIVNGSIFDKDGDGNPDANPEIARMKAKNGSKRVAIPTHFFKIIVRDCGDGKLESLAFLVPHDKAKHAGDDGLKYLVEHRRSIADIEAVSGLKLFPDATLERVTVHSMWPPKEGGSPGCGD